MSVLHLTPKRFIVHCCAAQKNGFDFNSLNLYFIRLFPIRLGNTAFAAKEYDTAIKHYTAAIALDSKNCVYYSNRR